MISVRLDTRQAKRQFAIGFALCAALAALMVVGAVVASRSLTRHVAGSAAIVMLTLAALIGYGGVIALRPRALVFSPAGVAYASRSRPWQVDWSELRTASVEHGWRPTRGSRLARQHRVRFVLVPHDDAAFAAGHPQLARFRARFGAPPGGYAFPLGPATALIAPLAEGLHAYGGPVDGGVRDLGRLPGGGLL